MSSPALSCVQPDSDISGVGVRVSFYCQVILYVVLDLFRDSAAAGEEGEEKREDAKSALSTLIVTNVAMQITAFITSFKKEISLPEGLVVIYLLTLSSPCILFSLPTPRASHNTESRLPTVNNTDVNGELMGSTERLGNNSMAVERKRSREFKNFIHIFAVLQSYTFSAYNLYLVFTTSSFGSNPECNSRANVALFACIPAGGRGLAFAQLVPVFVVIIKTSFFLNDLRKKEKNTNLLICRKKSMAAFIRCKRTMGNISRYRNTIKGGFILLVWMLAVINTEILISCNNLEGHGSSQWDFGQILPVILLADPLFDVVKHVSRLPWTKGRLEQLQKVLSLFKD